MKALVHAGPGRLEEQDLPRVPLRPTGALLRVEGCSACIGDAETLLGYGPVMDTPLVLGHEIVGRVLETGQEAPQSLREALGRRFVLDDNRPCGACEFCSNGHRRFCRSPRYGHIARDGSPDNWGGYAEILTLDDRSVLVPVAEDLSVELATFVFPTASGVEWLRAAAMSRGDRVAILGTSRMGVATAFVAASKGASEIVLYGAAEGTDAIAAAQSLGARYKGVLPASSDGAFDVVVVVTEAPASSLAVAVDIAGPMGRVVAASTARELASFEPETIRRKGVTMRGGRGASEASLAAASELVSRERIPLARIAGQAVGFGEAERELRSLLTSDRIVPGRHLVITPSGGVA